MNKYFLIILLSLLTFNISGLFSQSIQSIQSESKNALDSIISVAKTQSIYGNDVDWLELEQGIYDRFADSDSITSIIEPVKYMLEELGDYHGFFTVMGELYKADGTNDRTVSYDYKSKMYRDKMMEIYAHSIASTTINGRMLMDSIAYIEIPMISNNTGDEALNIEYTLKIRNKIIELNQSNPKGYIIDLRSNLGGTALPMLSGIGALFENIDIGGSTKDGKSFISHWSIQDGNAHLGDGNSIQNTPKTGCKCDITKTKKRIAVLVGRYTASSGELVASALKSQKNVMLFGEQTMGMSTVNGWFLISPVIGFNPATSYYMSKDSTAHIDGIIPDIEIPENTNYNDLTKGKVIEEAIKWLNSERD